MRLKQLQSELAHEIKAFRGRTRLPQCEAKVVGVNASRTYARLSNGQIVSSTTKPWANKAQMKQHKARRQAMRREAEADQAFAAAAAAKPKTGTQR